MHLIYWICDCGAAQVDDYFQTAAPMCSECGCSFDWSEIASPEALKDANAALQREVGGC